MTARTLVASVVLIDFDHFPEFSGRTVTVRALVRYFRVRGLSKYSTVAIRTAPQRPVMITGSKTQSAGANLTGDVLGLGFPCNEGEEFGLAERPGLGVILWIFCKGDGSQ